jgi:ferric-dicitrate binding protein FerR (iron transport regulator)
MSPDKLFNYIEGNLPEAERARIEEQIAADPQLQRELAIAQEMHRRSRGSREVMLESDDPEIPMPPKPIGRRLITAFAALVLVNVLVGIAFIIGKKDGTGEIRAREAATRRQLEASLQKTAETSLPLPTVGDEIHLPAAAPERERVANNVIVLAQQCGGSAAKALPDEKSIVVVVDLPSTRADEFRRALAPLAPPDYSPRPEPSPTADRRAIFQVRIADPVLPSPTP